MIRSIQTLTRHVDGSTPHGNPKRTTGRLTQVVNGKNLKVFSWYDNEWGYSNRMIDMARMMLK